MTKRNASKIEYKINMEGNKFSLTKRTAINVNDTERITDPLIADFSFRPTRSTYSPVPAIRIKRRIAASE